MYHPLKLSTIEATIRKHQTGSVAELTLPEQIAFLDGEIAKLEAMSHIITSAASAAEGFRVKRERLLAILYASKMPDIGGAFVLAKKAGAS